jgi:hypothetical protein
MRQDHGAYSMSRRSFCGTLAGVLVVPGIALALDAQQPARVPKIGILATTTQVSVAHPITAFRGCGNSVTSKEKRCSSSSASPTARLSDFPSSPAIWWPSSRT